MAPYQPRIAIIGAGPAGLTLGRLLYQKGIPATIYELRPKPTQDDLEKPCGMLDLHQESGISTLRKCGLYEEFLSLTGECSEETKVYHHDGRLLHHDFGSTSETARPEISRHALTNLLLSNIPAEMIKWNHKVRSVTSSTSASGSIEIEIDLESNGTETFDFVIGADGAWSKVRSLLTSVKPHYSGVQIITIDLQSVSSRHPNIAEFLGSGSMMASGFRKCFCAQRGSKGAARIYLMVNTPELDFGTMTGIGNMTASSAANKLANEGEFFLEWAQPFRNILNEAGKEATADNPSDRLSINALHMLPVGHRWDTKPSATLVGDAAHLMTPFAGEGVNLAMWDCQDLASAIDRAMAGGCTDAVDFQQRLRPLVEEYEKTMLTRAKEKAEETWANKALMIDDDAGSENLAKFFGSVGRNSQDN